MGPSKYLLERSRSGKVTKIPCRTGEEKRSYRGSLLPREESSSVQSPASPSSLARALSTPLKPGAPSRTPAPTSGIAAAAPGRRSPRGPHQPRLDRETCHLGAHQPHLAKALGLPYAERRASYAGFSPQPCSQTSWG